MIILDCKVTHFLLRPTWISRLGLEVLLRHPVSVGWRGTPAVSRGLKPGITIYKWLVTSYNYGFPIDKWLITMVFPQLPILQQVTWFKTCVCICHKNITVETPPYDTICSTISYIQVLDILEWRTFTSRSRKSPVGQELWVFHLEVPTWFVHPSFHLSYSI